MVVYFATSGGTMVNCGETIGKQMLSHARMSTQSTSKSCFSFFRSGQFRQKYASATFRRTFDCCHNGRRAFSTSSFVYNSSREKRNWKALTMKSLISSTVDHQMDGFGLLSRCQNMILRLSIPKYGNVSKISWKTRPKGGAKGGTSTGLLFGVCLGVLSLHPIHAKVVANDKNDEIDSSLVNSSHGKKVYTDYSITGIPGDGRCLFRSVAHGACLRSGKPSPDEILQRELADELRVRVADEFVKRREETEWFVEGDFDTYVAHIRKPHVWGGEPELFMASHVLQMPITVYMHDENSGGLIIIAEYGQEYGKDDPVRVLYHGFGHYDALQIPGKRGTKSRLYVSQKISRSFDWRTSKMLTNERN